MLAGIDQARARSKGRSAKWWDQSLPGLWGHLCRLLGADTPVVHITYAAVEGYIARRRGEGARGQGGERALLALALPAQDS